jgi:hypothetical protein
MIAGYSGVPRQAAAGYSEARARLMNSDLAAV